MRTRVFSAAMVSMMVLGVSTSAWGRTDEAVNIKHLSRSESLPVGDKVCEAGGTKVFRGDDLNFNRVLDLDPKLGEVDHVSYLCNPLDQQTSKTSLIDTVLDLLASVAKAQAANLQTAESSSRKQKRVSGMDVQPQPAPKIPDAGMAK